jgi:hypothetical protein
MQMSGKLFEVMFLSLQGIVVAFLLLHDWISLGRLNNLAAIESEDTMARRVFVTLLAGAPAAAGLFFSSRHFGRSYPGWLEMLLWITYGVLLLGLLRAWWIPYLVKPDAERAARYQILFAGTHTFLPRRNGLAPNTLHSVFHVCVVAALVALFLRDHFIFSGLHG